MTTSRACSSCFPVANRFKGFVTARKWSALPLYVLWSQYGFSMSILSFDILPTPSAPATRSFSYRLLSLSLSLSHTCSVSSPRYTHPHHATGFFASCSLDSKTTRGRFHTNPRERTLTRLRRIASRDWIEPLHNAISSPPSPPCSTFRSRYFSLSVLLSASHPFDAVIDNACTPAWPPPCHRRFSLPPPPTDGDTFIDGQFAVWDFILFFFFFGTLKFYFIKIVKNFF